MKTTAELEQDIVDITTNIDEKFPALSKYIKKKPAKISGTHKEVLNNKNLEEYYNSLVQLLREHSKTQVGIEEKKATENSKLPGYPLYAASEDIYKQGKKEMELNPNDLSKNKVPNEEIASMNEKTFLEDMSGDDLDVPGSELDDQQESVGSEDEENNYYSLGGDNHNDLEEDKG